MYFPRVGFGAGAASSNRSSTIFRPGNPAQREICELAGGKALDLCLATNDFGGAVVRGNRPTCSADTFCREDYMCQAFPPDTPGLAKVKGFCAPTYFIYQMRIDNHPTPS